MSRRAQLVEAAVQAHKAAMHVLWAAMEPQWLRLDLTMSQLKGLFVLMEHNAITVGELAAALGVGRPAASMLVEGLVQKDLARRAEDAADRRRTLVELSPRGETLLMRLRQDGRQVLSAWFGQLDDADLAALAQGLQALAATPLPADTRDAGDVSDASEGSGVSDTVMGTPA